MFGKTFYKEDNSSYILQYEKKKMRECAGSLQSLAKAFLTEEREEEKETDRQNLFLKRRLRENRVLMADHLKEMAKIIKEMSEEQIRILRLGEKKEKQISKMLLQEGLVLEDIYFLEKSHHRKEIMVRICQGNTCGKSESYSAKEVGEFLSVFFNMRLVPAFHTPFFVLDRPCEFWFEEDVKYTVLTGYAKAVKEGEKVSGDNISFFETSDKNSYGILSDGMGSGEKACKDSEVVIEMAENFLESGFSEEFSARMINDALIVSGEGKNMSTLDLCSIDLYTAKASFLKVGAVSSFLKRDSYVEEISSASLPLGVFHGLEIDYDTKQLLDGDYVFLFSDGVMESFWGEEGKELLKELIMEIPYKRPTEMAGHLMKRAILSGNGKIKDDITILVMGIWKND